MKNSSRIVVFDTETTGLRYGIDNIIEIAAVEIVDNLLTGNQFHCYFPARKSIDQTARACHKMDNTFYSNFCAGYYKETRQGVTSFINFVGNSPLYGHNVKFDKKHLEHDCQTFGIATIPDDQYFCSMKMFFDQVSSVHPRLKYSVRLEECCKFFNIPSRTNEYHTALFDALMAAKLVINLFEFSSPNNLFRNKEIDEKLLLSEEKYFAIKETRALNQFLNKKRQRDEIDETIEKQLGIGVESVMEVNEKFKSSLDINDLFEGMDEKEVGKYIGMDTTDEEIDDELLDMIEQDETQNVKEEVAKYREALKTYINQLKSGN